MWSVWARSGVNPALESLIDSRFLLFAVVAYHFQVGDVHVAGFISMFSLGDLSRHGDLMIQVVI